ncbi:hypothetical protein HDU98_007595 [Podochytrium sp. JEL0797]|nr:hypothetical protein HDU98_007595 [Podochytrium sp. JEL0797]
MTLNATFFDRPESPQWNPGFYYAYTSAGFLLAGSLLNAVVLSAMVSKRKTLIVSRMDRIMVLLLLVVLVAGLLNAAHFLFRLISFSETETRVFACLASSIVLAIYFTNLALAMDRSDSIQSPELGVKLTRQPFRIMWMLFLAASAVFVWAFATSVRMARRSPLQSYR